MLDTNGNRKGGWDHVGVEGKWCWPEHGRAAQGFADRLAGEGRRLAWPGLSARLQRSAGSSGTVRCDGRACRAAIGMQARLLRERGASGAVPVLTIVGAGRIEEMEGGASVGPRGMAGALAGVCAAWAAQGRAWALGDTATGVGWGKHRLWGSALLG
ncbi:hypothetical protein ZEAMMB73_Zm00001d004194, partial [Zea mays]